MNPRLRTTRATAADIPRLVPLLQRYMREAYGTEWTGSQEALQADALGQRCAIELACYSREGIVGFLAWHFAYDLHHSATGIEVIDLFVEPRRRSHGVALALACAAAAAAHPAGALFMKGTALPSGSGLRLYNRIAVCEPTGCIVSGRAFRRLAELANRPVREIACHLPELIWNYER